MSCIPSYFSFYLVAVSDCPQSDCYWSLTPWAACSSLFDDFLIRAPLLLDVPGKEGDGLSIPPKVPVPWLISSYGFRPGLKYFLEF